MNKVEWHDFSKEMPPKEGEYLVTTQHSDLSTNVSVGVFYFRHAFRRWQWLGEEVASTVIAWAELPEPYKGHLKYLEHKK